MTTASQYAPSGNSFAGNVYRDGFAIINYNTANDAIAPGIPVAAGDGTSEPVDKNVISKAGVMRLGVGDGAEIMFVLGGTVSSPTFLVTEFIPYLGVNGLIAGYIEVPLVDSGAAYSASSTAVGAALGSIYNTDGSVPTSAIPDTAVWGKAIVAAGNAVSLATNAISNNADIKQVTGEFPSRLRITPSDGATHIRVQQKTGGGTNPKQWALARRLRGGALNK